MNDRMEKYREREIKLSVAVGLREAECDIVKIGRVRGLRTKFMPVSDAADLLLQMQEGEIQPFDMHHRHVVAQVVNVRGRGYQLETPLNHTQIPGLLAFLRDYATPRNGAKESD